MTHTIRLRGAWESSTGVDTTRHGRKFGRPRKLDENERIWLVCKNVPGPAGIYLNGTLIGEAKTCGPFDSDITELIQARNTVLLDVASSEALGEIALEIRSKD
jgi:hypothetical protein